jgi:formylglycine-generating enzyme required for sulfatase activity
MRDLLVRVILLCLFVASGTVVHATGVGDQDFATKGAALLKQKQYAEARSVLEAGLLKDPSNKQAHFYLAEACRGMKSWVCAEKHYETAIELELDVSIASGSTVSRLPVPRHKAWQLHNDAKVWRLLEEARGLLVGGQVQPEKMKLAQNALDKANELGFSDEQRPIHEYLLTKLPGQRKVSPKPDGLSAQGALPEDPREAPMVLVPAGEFSMGSTMGDDEKPVHRIYLNAFYIDKYEVTVGQYAKYLQATGMEEPSDWNIMNQAQHRKRPVVNINWSDAATFCKWAGKRLPTEAEWEKAARGTDGRIYPWGDEAPTRLHANFGKKEWDNHLALVPGGSFEMGKSPYGIYDMAGNAWEWVNDWYEHDYYKKSPAKNPQGPTKGESKVVRGGSWLYVPDFLRTAFRFNAEPSGRHFGYGFRCAKTP